MSPAFDHTVHSLGLRAWQMAERTQAAGRWADRLIQRPTPGLIKLGVNPGGRFVQRWLALPPGRMPLIQRLHHAEQSVADPGVWLRRAETLTPTRNRQAQAEPDGWSAGVMDRRPTVRVSPSLVPSNPIGSRPVAHPSEPAQPQWFSQTATAPTFAMVPTAPAWAGSSRPGRVSRALDLTQHQPLALSQARPLTSASMPPTTSTIVQPVQQPARSLDLLSRSLVSTVHDQPTSGALQPMATSAALGDQPTSGAPQRMATGAASGVQPAGGALQPIATSATLGMMQPRALQRAAAAANSPLLALPHSDGPGSRPQPVQGQTVLLGNEAFSGIARHWTPSPPVLLSRMWERGNSEVQLARRDVVRGVGHPFLSTHEPQRERVGAGVVRGSNRQGSTNYEPAQAQPAEGVPQPVVFPSSTVVGTQTAWVQPARLMSGSDNWLPRSSQRQTLELAAPPSLAQTVLQRLAQAPQAQREALPSQSDQALTPLLARTQLAPAASQPDGSLLNPGGLGLNAASRKLGSNAAREQRAALDHLNMSSEPSWFNPQAGVTSATVPSLMRSLVAPSTPHAGFEPANTWSRTAPAALRPRLDHELISRMQHPGRLPWQAPHANPGGALQSDRVTTGAPSALPFVSTLHSPNLAGALGAGQSNATPAAATPARSPAAPLAQRLVAALPAAARSQPDGPPLALSAQRPLAATQALMPPASPGLEALARSEAPHTSQPATHTGSPSGQTWLSRYVSQPTSGLEPVTPSRPMLADAPPQFGPNEPGPTLITPAPAVARGPELLRPITSVQRAPVELAATASLPDQAQLSLSSPAAAPASAAAAEPDLDALAQKVYERLQRRLRIDHERIGRY